MDDAHDSAAVEVPIEETKNEPGTVGAVATATDVVAVDVPFTFVAVIV